ncbi:hypothetical protein ACFFGR_05550 [Arthrobacter liuii]|uniref:Uncharacterized protein n=1 Tax=Arthrobacter liuii TaxID=1476996 RepID=A0ABQ2ALK7_9MICC|nr:hypothetical protein [Arthrobacter liuii]GGH91586.1 hypothetical protein GCM10007170_08080 [Arthrobacter liuii]
MDQGSTAFIQWLCWTVAVVSAGTALVRAGVASTAGPRIVREKSGQIGMLWILCAASVITGFILAAAAVRSGS